MRDGWRLAVGTLTVLRVPPPSSVGPREARAAMLLAPLAVVPLGVAVGLVLAAGDVAGLPALATGLVGVGVLALGTRALHLDGLSDTADGLTASYDPVRSLEVMRSGASGPAGGAAVLVVLGLQASALASLSHSLRGAVVAGLLVCCSRLALWLTCARGVPAARADGLGGTHAGVVPPRVAAFGWLAVITGTALLATWLGHDWWRGALTGLAAAAVVLALVRRAVRRLGGVTGDVYGAAVELALAALLLGCS